MTKEAVCIPNISLVERRKRLAGGAVVFLVGLFALSAMAYASINPWWRLALFPLFMGASSGYFQWRDKT